jgi:hypothetical protein
MNEENEDPDEAFEQTLRAARERRQIIRRAQKQFFWPVVGLLIGIAWFFYKTFFSNE